MGMQLNIVTQSFGAPEDNSWLGSQLGTDVPDPITLDAASFATLAPTGVVPSGCLLQKITASGRYGPLDVAATGTGRELITQAAMQTVYVLYKTVDLTNGGTQPASANWQNAGAAGLWTAQIITAKLPYSTGAGGPTQTGVLAALQQYAQRYHFV